MPGTPTRQKGVALHIRKKHGRLGARFAHAGVTWPTLPGRISAAKALHLFPADATAPLLPVQAPAWATISGRSIINAFLGTRTRAGQPERAFSATTGIDPKRQQGRRGTGFGPGCVPTAIGTFHTSDATLPGLARLSAAATWRFTATKLSGDTEIESIPAVTSSLAKAGSLLGA
jgi:hypothetical protein